MNNQPKFSMDFWNSDHERNFKIIAADLNSKNYTKELLEIGVFEGRTSLWLLDNVKDCNIELLEPDPGPNFHNNLDEVLNKGERAVWIEDYSFTELRTDSFNYYDFIYEDSDHCACSVLENAILAWRALKVGGILLFDDYLMEVRDPWFYISHKEYAEYKEYGLVWQHPRVAIDAFLNIYKGQYKILIDNYQIGIIKVCELGGKNLNHGDNTQKAIYG
jgi:hypothetical protein